MNDTQDIEAKFARIEELNKQGSFADLPMNPKEMIEPANFIPAAQADTSNISGQANLVTSGLKSEGRISPLRKTSSSNKLSHS